MNADSGLAPQRPGRGMQEHIDSSGQQRRKSRRGSQGHELDPVGIAENRGGERTAKIDIEPLPSAGGVLQREACQRFGHAAANEAVRFYFRQDFAGAP